MSGSGISWAICKSALHSRQITTPAPHHSVYRPDALPATQPTVSKHWRQVPISIIWYQSRGGDAQQLGRLGLASQTSVYPPTGSWPKKGRWGPHLYSSWGMAHFTFNMCLITAPHNVTHTCACQTSVHRRSSRQFLTWELLFSVSWQTRVHYPYSHICQHQSPLHQLVTDRHQLTHIDHTSSQTTNVHLQGSMWGLTTFSTCTVV